MVRRKRKKERQQNMNTKDEEQLQDKAEETEAAAQTQDASDAKAPEAEENGTPEEKNPLQEMLKAAQAKTAEYLAMAQRVQADFENFRKRNESVRADAYAEGRKDVAAMMLPVLLINCRQVSGIRVIQGMFSHSRKLSAKLMKRCTETKKQEPMLRTEEQHYSFPKETPVIYQILLQSENIVSIISV